MSDKNVSEQLAHLSKIATELNEAGDEAREVITEFENRLEATNIGLECWLWDQKLEPWEDATGDSEAFTIIGWDKFGGNWRLVVARAKAFAGEIHEFSADEPLVNASRTIRVQSVPLLQKLLAKLVADGEQHAEVVRKTIAAVRKEVE